MPQKLASIDERAQAALAKVLGEMPDVKPVTASSSHSGLLARLFQPKNSQATTNPFTGNITYTPEQIEGLSDAELENTMAHELTHSRQAQNTPWYKTLAGMAGQLINDVKPPTSLSPSSPINSPYFWRPEEMEAFQTERNRTMNKKLPIYTDPMLGTRDIPLFPERKKGIDTAPTKRGAK